LGNADNYVKAVGVGECAGVVIDFGCYFTSEAKDKLTFAQEAFEDKKLMLFTYMRFVNGAKALLLARNQNKSPRRNHQFV
jgi:sulfite reductase (ferredoxin)